MLKIGHRGAPLIAPGNTMASFRAAHAAGCDWVECDCRVSSDGIVVLSHDAMVTDRLGASHTIETTPAKQLAALDLGCREGVLTLDELVAWAVGKVGVMADIKVSDYEETIATSLLPIAREQRVISGADKRGRQRFRAADPCGPISITVNVSHESDRIAQQIALDCEAVTLEFPLITARRVAELHARSIQVFAWTPDNLETMWRLVADGVDGVISNRVDLLAKL